MANDFSGASDCLAVWNFQGAMTADSKGSHTLTNYNTVLADTTNYKRGTQSALFSGTNGLSIVSNNLVAGFPLKDGDTTLIGTVCFWIRDTKAAGGNVECTFYSKDKLSDKKGLHLNSTHWTNPSRMDAHWGYTTNQQEFTDATPSIVQNQWYHIAVAFDGVNKTLKWRIWDDTNSTVVTKTFSPTNALTIDAANYSLWIGAGFNGIGGLIGNLNELVVFNTIKSDADIDKIRSNTYGAVPAATGNMFLSF